MIRPITLDIAAFPNSALPRVRERSRLLAHQTVQRAVQPPLALATSPSPSRQPRQPTDPRHPAAPVPHALDHAPNPKSP